MEPSSLARRFFRTSSSGHVLLLYWTLILFVSLSSLPNNIVLSAPTNPTSVVLGTVTDAETTYPIGGASIVASRTVSVGTGRTVTYQNVVYSTETEENGSYMLIVDGGFNYQFYVYSDNPSTPGYDYVPKFQNSARYWQHSSTQGQRLTMIRTA